jgi:hypothetical protein
MSPILNKKKASNQTRRTVLQGRIPSKIKAVANKPQANSIKPISSVALEDNINKGFCWRGMGRD